MSENELRQRLYDAYKHRAILYYLIYDEMRQEFGAETAAKVLKRAIYRRGRTIGQKYAQYGPDNLDGLKQAFLSNVPDDGKMFAPAVEESDPEALDIVLQSCPLKDAWQEAELSDEETATLCEIAAEIDQGTFEAAGFTFSASTWQPGADGCCHLHIRPGPSTEV